MKVLIVAPGDSQHAKRWIERLHSAGISCIFLDMTSEDTCLDLPIDSVYRNSYGNTYLVSKRLFAFSGLIGKSLFWCVDILKTKKLLKKILDSEKPSLVNLHWLFHPTANGVLFQNRVPVISTPWGSDLLVPEYQGKFKFPQRVFHQIAVSHVITKSTAFCCDAPHMRDLLLKFGANTDAVELIYFGTDVNRFNPLMRDSKLRKSWGILDDEILILSNRQLAEVYDIPTLLHAFRLASQINEKLKLLIASGGPLRESLEELAIELNIHQKVTFAGRLSDEEFAAVTASADVYVSTSPTDGGIAASVAEAMSSEVPVIITRFGDNEQWVKQETAGLLFDARNAKELSQCLLKLAGNSNLRTALGQKGRQVILLENNSEIELMKILALYRKVLH